MNHWVELNVAALQSNLCRLRQALAPAIRLVFVVKANAYGHGLEPVVRSAAACGVRDFAVAHLEEAEDLRRILPDARILLVGCLDARHVAEAVQLHVTPVLVDEAHARALALALHAKALQMDVHIKVDTGMGRLGFPWETAAASVAAWAADPVYRVMGLCTHFASSDSDDTDFFEEQSRRFRSVVDAVRVAGLTLSCCHASNSGAILRDAGQDYDGVRPGIMLYGYSPRMTPGPGSRQVITAPVLQWKTRLLQVKAVRAGVPVSYQMTWRASRDTRVGTVDAGYADGYPRALGNCGFMLVGGRRCPVIGRVTMSLIMLDLGPEARDCAGDEVVMLGRQGTESLWADEMAAWNNTIAYEVLTRIQVRDRRLTGAEDA